MIEQMNEGNGNIRAFLRDLAVATAGLACCYVIGVLAWAVFGGAV